MVKKNSTLFNIKGHVYTWDLKNPALGTQGAFTRLVQDWKSNKGSYGNITASVPLIGLKDNS